MNQAEVFEEHRKLLFSIAYRMTGSAADAEDIVQDAFVRFSEAAEIDVHSPKSYLAKIVTHLCLNHLTSARARREEYVGTWLPEPILTVAHEANPERKTIMAESLSMAFLILLESLSSVERAVFLLREVFDYDYAEISTIVCKTEDNCRQLFNRAKKHITARPSRFEVATERQRLLVQEFGLAATLGDLSGLLKVMNEDIVLYSDGGGKVNAARKPIFGNQKVASLLLGVLKKFAPINPRYEPAIINSQPGIIGYDAEKIVSATIFDIIDDRITTIFIVNNPDKLVGILQTNE